MAVNFIVCRVKKSVYILRGGVDMFGFDDPNADAFVAAGVHVAGIFKRHRGIGGMEAADVFVAKPLFGADKDFPKWPIFHVVVVGKVNKQGNG
jgi:hypothetical protein